MKKIPTLFNREFEGHRVVKITDEITPGCGEAFLHGVATVKIDGACCAIIDGELYKRYDAKHGKNPPEGAIPCCDPDPVTGHWPHWVKVDRNDPGDRWFVRAAGNTPGQLFNGTYEAVGKHFNNNPYGLCDDILEPHGVKRVELERSFVAVKEYLENNYIEGLVFWLNGEPVCKIKRKDFGFPADEIRKESEGFFFMANGYFERGEMYDILFNDGLAGEMAAHRPGVIISSDKGNTTSPTVTMIYTTTTTQGNKQISVNHRFVQNGWTNYALCNQIVTVNKTRLKKFYGKLSDYDMGEIDRCLQEAMSLSYVDEAALKEKDAEIKDRDVLIGELKTEVAGAKAEVAKKDEEIASLKMEIEMWQKCYGRCMDMLVDTKVKGDLTRRITKVEVVATNPKEPETPPVNPPVNPPEEQVDNRVDINSCTATALKKVGFSLAVARKIVESRPFKSVEDLKRINGVKSNLYRVLEPKLRCVAVEGLAVEDLPPVKQVSDPGFELLNINAATAQEISDVVGICVPTCYSIVGYRKKNGPYTKLEDLLGVHCIYPGSLKKFEGKIEFGEVVPEVEAVAPVVVQDGVKVNVNTASAVEIHEKTGLAMCACYAITGKRNREGQFKSLKDLVIPGRLSEAHLAKFLDKMEV